MLSADAFKFAAKEGKKEMSQREKILSLIKEHVDLVLLYKLQELLFNRGIKWLTLMILIK